MLDGVWNLDGEEGRNGEEDESGYYLLERSVFSLEWRSWGEIARGEIHACSKGGSAICWNTHGSLLQRGETAIAIGKPMCCNVQQSMFALRILFPHGLHGLMRFELTLKWPPYASSGWWGFANVGAYRNRLNGLLRKLTRFGFLARVDTSAKSTFIMGMLYDFVSIVAIIYTFCSKIKNILTLLT